MSSLHEGERQSLFTKGSLLRTFSFCPHELRSSPTPTNIEPDENLKEIPPNPLFQGGNSKKVLKSPFLNGDLGGLPSGIVV